MGRRKLTEQEAKLAKIKRLEKLLTELRKEVNLRPNIELGNEKEVDTTIPEENLKEE